MNFMERPVYEAKLISVTFEKWAEKRTKLVTKLAGGFSSNTLNEMVTVSAQDKLMRIMSHEIRLMAEVAEGKYDKDLAIEAVELFRKELKREIDRWTPLHSTSLVDVAENNEYFEVMRNLSQMV